MPCTMASRTLDCYKRFNRILGRLHAGEPGEYIEMPTTKCPECEEEVYVDAESEQGDTVTCDECGSGLVVVGLDPIELDLKADTDDPYDENVDSIDYEDDRY